MALKRKSETFAGAAKRIANTFTRADFDEAEKRDRDQMLQTLSEEQEAYKVANGMADPTAQAPQIQQGGQPQGQPPMFQTGSGGVGDKKNASFNVLRSNIIQQDPQRSFDITEDTSRRYQDTLVNRLSNFQGSNKERRGLYDQLNVQQEDERQRLIDEAYPQIGALRNKVFEPQREPRPSNTNIPSRGAVGSGLPKSEPSPEDYFNQEGLGQQGQSAPGSFPTYAPNNGSDPAIANRVASKPLDSLFSPSTNKSYPRYSIQAQLNKEKPSVPASGFNQSFNPEGQSYNQFIAPYLQDNGQPIDGVFTPGSPEAQRATIQAQEQTPVKQAAAKVNARRTTAKKRVPGANLDKLKRTLQSPIDEVKADKLVGVESNQAEIKANIDRITKENAKAKSTDEAEGDSPKGPKGSKTSIAPSIVSGAISGIGNLLLASQQKAKNIKLGRVTPEKISLARQRDALEKELRLQGNIAKRNIKSGSRGRGDYLSNVAATSAGLQKEFGNQVGKSFQAEELANADSRQKAAQTNASLAAKEELANTEEENRARAAREAYLSGAVNAIPGTLKDINQIRNQDKLINILGNKYKLDNKGEIVYTGGKSLPTKKTKRVNKKKK